MQEFEIKSVNGAVLFRAAAESFVKALEAAVRAEADLRRADLDGANWALKNHRVPTPHAWLKLSAVLA